MYPDTKQKCENRFVVWIADGLLDGGGNAHKKSFTAFTYLHKSARLQNDVGYSFQNVDCSEIWSQKSEHHHLKYVIASHDFQSMITHHQRFKTALIDAKVIIY